LPSVLAKAVLAVKLSYVIATHPNKIVFIKV